MTRPSRMEVERLGAPALAGAGGLLAGTYAGQHTEAVVLTLVLTVLGLVAGAVSGESASIALESRLFEQQVRGQKAFTT